MGFLPQVVIWIHKIQYRIVSTHKSKVSEIGQVVRILEEFYFLAISELRGSGYGCFQIGLFFSVEAQTLWTLMSTDPSLSIRSALWAWRRGHKLSPKSNLCKSFWVLKLCHFSWLFVKCDRLRCDCFPFVLDKCILLEKTQHSLFSSDNSNLA